MGLTDKFNTIMLEYKEFSNLNNYILYLLLHTLVFWIVGKYSFFKKLNLWSFMRNGEYLVNKFCVAQYNEQIFFQIENRKRKLICS